MNQLVNLGSLSLITLDGIPNLGNTWQRYRSATPLADMVSLQGIVIIIFVQSWSVTVKIKPYPSDRGNLTMKSMAIVWKGNASASGVIGFRGALIACVFTLFC